MDMASIDKWQEYTAAKEDMFRVTDTDIAPWIVVKSNDKKRARINAMRFCWRSSTTTTRTRNWSAKPDPLMVGRALED
jgi:polyphosphate kinase